MQSIPKRFSLTVRFIAAAIIPFSMSAAQPQFSLRETAKRPSPKSVAVFRTPPATTAYGKKSSGGAAIDSTESKWLDAVGKMSVKAFGPAFRDHFVGTVALGPSNFEDGDSRMEVHDASLVWYDGELAVKFPFNTTGKNGQTAHNPGSVVFGLEGLRAGASYVARCRVSELEPGHEWVVKVGQTLHTVKPLSNGDMFFGVEAGTSKVDLIIEAPTYPCPESSHPGWCNMYSPHFFGCYLELQ